MAKTRNKYYPDYLPHPGETLAELLDEREMSQKELALRTGLSPKAINEIVKGKALPSRETADKFEPIFGLSANFWMDKSNRYMDYISEAKKRHEAEKQFQFLKQFPFAKAFKFNFVVPFKTRDPYELYDNFLKYFKVSSVEQWKEMWLNPSVAYRKSPAYENNPFAASMWLRQGIIQAENIACELFDKQKAKNIIPEIKKLTMEPNPEIFIPKLLELCCSVGIAVVLIPSIQGCTASGATKWLNSDKVMLLLSLRHKTNDHFWFSFFHEFGHILLHGKKDTFIEDKNSRDVVKEQEADDFASNTLISKSNWDRFEYVGRFDQKSIVDFASKVGVAPGIVLGRLQKKELLPYQHVLTKKLKVYYKWREESA